MTDIYVLESDSFKAYHNQALEKYLLEDVKDDTVILYLWQNEKTIVIGRNQDAYAECDIARLEKENGYLARRITGGGAVYHDRGNLNFTFVCPKDLYDPDEQDEIILAALDSLGIESEKNGRNDLLVTLSIEDIILKFGIINVYAVLNTARFTASFAVFDPFYSLDNTVRIVMIIIAGPASCNCDAFFTFKPSVDRAVPVMS